MSPSSLFLLTIKQTGSNLQALLDAPYPKLNIVHVLSNRKAAYGLTRAANATPPVATSVFALKPYLTAHPGKTREDYDAQLAQLVVEQRPDLIVLAGWMHILSNNFLSQLFHPDQQQQGSQAASSARKPIPIINLHPALPGAFDGAHAIERAWQAFQDGQITKTGVMVHEVVSEVDKGRPLAVREVDCRAGESVDALEARIHAVEHDVLVEATQKLAKEIEEKEGL